jgi:hypothetical protein
MSRARWLRRYCATTIFGFATMMLPVLWFALTRAYLAGDWQVTLDFGALGEGPAELVLITLMVPISWLGVIGFHELLRQTAGGTDA